MATPVVTRFAPSPTGFLHIGGARTALFNWLYARAKGGKMLLRIEDTDRKRSTPEAIEAILDGLTWLGLDWEGEAVYQHKRDKRHREVALSLLEAGKAYKCFCTADELSQMRERARSEGRPPIYDRTWRDRDPGEAPAGIEPAIRFKAPIDGETVIEDHVQGQVTFKNEVLDDLILLRSDGTPTYMLSVVVDDHDMNISHVIRGDDHLTNAGRQSQIYRALGWPAPQFAHIPLIHGPDGQKLSKRHGALGIEAYRDMGYLPDGLRNYLVRLGWSHGDDEIMSLDDMTAWFDLDSINKAPARFDMDKLAAVNAYYLRALDNKTLAGNLLGFIAQNQPGRLEGLDIEVLAARLETAMGALKERAKTYVDLAAQAEFLLATRPLEIDDKACKLLDEDARGLLRELAGELKEISDWQGEILENRIRDFVENRDIKLGAVAQPLRAALTGTTQSPGIFDLLFVLGKEEALSRLEDQCRLDQALDRV
jgi:glutamyl-tRNA synthetase